MKLFFSRALEVLHLILTYQFSTRLRVGGFNVLTMKNVTSFCNQRWVSLFKDAVFFCFQSFVGMFKQAEIGKFPKNKTSVLESLLHDSFDALDQNK